jgi:hypothetical protein
VKGQHPETEPIRYRPEPRLEVVAAGSSLFVNSRRGVRRYECADPMAFRQLLLRLETDWIDPTTKDIDASREDVREVLGVLVEAGVVRPSRARDGRAAWSGPFYSAKDLARETTASTVIMGDCLLTDRIVSGLPHQETIVRLGSYQPRVSAHAPDATVMYRTSAPARSATYATSSHPVCNEEQLRVSLVDKRCLVFVLCETSVGSILEVSRIASELDVFVVLVEADDAEVRVGPMLPPKTPSWIEQAFALYVRDADSSVLDILHRGTPEMGVPAVGLAVDAIATAMSHPSLPFLWCRAVCSGDGVTVESLGIHELARLESSSRWLGIDRYLQSETGEGNLLEAVGAALRQDHLVIIDGAFREDFATAVYGALERCTDWGFYESVQPRFHFRHHNLYGYESFPCELLTSALIFGSHQTKTWIEMLTGRGCANDVTISASRYMPGDHSLPHSDCDEGRQVAFVWHLTQRWNARWGGHLVWIPAGAILEPTFNTLTLFNVSSESLHFVSTVAASAEGKRLTVNGWWRGDGTPRGVVCRPQATQLNSKGTFRSFPSWPRHT